jgi:hypothetical protein
MALSRRSINMGLFRRREPADMGIDAARVTLVAREWAKELGGFQSPEADAVLLGMCSNVTLVSAVGRQGRDRDDVQWKCICRGLKEYPDTRRRLEKVPADLKCWVAFGELVMNIVGDSSDFSPNVGDGIPIAGAVVRSGHLPPSIDDLTETLRSLANA